MNRGIGHRPIFETRVDVRYFLSRVARVVHDGLLEVHAYAVLTTHFHLLVTSPQGRLDAAMRLVQDAYARRFNRTRERDGGVFRDRYRAKRVDDTYYRDAVIWYIDRNAVEAGMAGRPEEYPYCSAREIARRASGPPWLSRRHAEDLARDRARLGAHLEPAAMSSSPLWTVVDRWIETGASSPARLKDLVSGSPEYVQRWLHQNARSADGGRAGTLIVHPATIRNAVRTFEAATPDEGDGRPADDVVRVVEAGLLYSTAALPVRAIAELTSSAESTVVTRIRRYRGLIQSDARSRRFASEVFRRAVEADYSPLRSSEWGLTPLRRCSGV